MTNKNPLDDVLGQPSAVGLLMAGLESNRVPHAYLFSGPEGVGKKKAARAWAQILLCQNRPTPVTVCGTCPPCQKAETESVANLIWVDFAFQAALKEEEVGTQKSLKIDTVRALERQLHMRPAEGTGTIAVISPADLLTGDASHALLKIVEEPPTGTHLVLIAQEAGSLLPTIRSRCQRVRFSPLSVETVTRVLEKRHGHRTLDDITRAARACDGSMERAETLMNEEENLNFDWAGAPLSELWTWCEGLQHPRFGRTAAERLLLTILRQFQEEGRTGQRPADDLRRVFDALTRLRQNAAVALTLQHLFIHLRRDARRREIL